MRERKRHDWRDGMGGVVGVDGEESLGRKRKAVR